MLPSEEKQQSKKPGKWVLKEKNTSFKTATSCTSVSTYKNPQSTDIYFTKQEATSHEVASCLLGVPSCFFYKPNIKHIYHLCYKNTKILTLNTNPKN